jgi:hypothetical protein
MISEAQAEAQTAALAETLKQDLRKLSFPRKRESRRLPSMASGLRYPSRNDGSKRVWLEGYLRKSCEAKQCCRTQLLE